MVLSIGMIVKNGEQYLEQCLTAIQPILKELDSELIIADTGSTDKTVEIAKKFTDNVFYFEWVNDFSAARNSTLEKAQGEWFMYIDQDEVAIDCTGVINFFKSGEYRKYNTAAYVQRNLLFLDDLDNYRDFRQIIAVKRTPETRFINEFHEQLYPISQPVKFLDFIVNHYGFAYGGEDGEQRARDKSARNLKGLFDEIEHTVGEPRITIYSQIADCYSVLKEYDKALEYLNIAIDKLNHANVEVTILYYFKLTTLYYNLQDYDKLIETVDEYFDDEINPIHESDHSVDCQFRLYRADACYKVGKYRDAIGEFVKGFDLYRRYVNNKLLTNELAMIDWFIFGKEIKRFYRLFFTCCIREKEFELAEKYARVIPLENYLDDEEYMRVHIDMRIILMKFTAFNGFGELYSRLDGRRKEYLRRAVYTLSPKDRDMMLKKMSVLGGTAKELAEIYKVTYYDDRVDMEKISAFLKAHGSETAHDIFYLMLKCQADITPFVTAEDFNAEHTVRTMEALFEDSIQVFQAYKPEAVSPNGISGVIRLYAALMPRVLEKELPISSLFEKYGRLGLQWKKSFEITAQVPDDIFSALHASVAVLAKLNKDRDKFTKAISELKKHMPTLEDVANAYEWESEDSFPAAAPTPQNEFVKLAAKVKQDIRRLIVTGKLADAKNLLGEFKALCPNDPDIASIAEELGEIY